MNIKFALSFLLTISSFAFSMQQDGMTVLKKWEDAQQFAGRIVAFKPLNCLEWDEGYRWYSINGVDRYGFISPEAQRSDDKTMEGYELIVLRKREVPISYFIILNNSFCLEQTNCKLEQILCYD